MAYKKQTWVDDETVGTADRFNHMESGIEEAGKTGGVSAGAVVGWTKEEIPEGYEEIMLPSDVPVGMIANVEKDANIPEGYEAAIGKSIIQVGYNGSTAFKVTTGDAKTFVPMAKTILSKGNGFEVLSDGSIKVKKKMYAKAKAQTMLTTSGSGDKVLMIDLNQYDWSYDRVYSLKDYVNLKTDTYIIELKENDILKLYYQGDSGDTFHTSSAFVFMTVEEVDNPNKPIKKVAVTPVKPISGSIVDGTNIDDKVSNTYSANTIDGLLAPQMITTILSEYQTTASTAEKVKLDKVYGSCGDKLTLSNNEVVIGENINVVEISANVHLVYNSPAGGIAIKVTKNDSEIVAMSGNKPNNQQGAQIVITPIIISVKKGDKIAISYTGGSGHILTSYRTYMTIKKIK